MRKTNSVERRIPIALAGLAFSVLTWPVAATTPITQIILEDGSPYYVPVTATALSSSTIKWANPTATHHTVTHSGCFDDSLPCAFDSGTLPPGSTFTLHGLPAGRYAYHCRIHPIMRGVLAVTDDSSTASPL